MRTALAIGAALLVLGGFGAVLVLRDPSPSQTGTRVETVAAAGISLHVPTGWTGRASEFDERMRTPVVEVRRGETVRIEVVELGNQPGVGRFRRTKLPITLRTRDVRRSAALGNTRAIVGRLFATQGRSLSVHAEVERAQLPQILREVNGVIASLGVQPAPGLDSSTQSRLERPLALPRARGPRCPRSRVTRSSPATAFPLGAGPAYPSVGPGGVAVLDPSTLRSGWFRHKTLWAVSPAYRGPLLIRGARIDAPGPVRFEDRRPLQRRMRWPAMWPAQRGWRYYPSTTALRGPGCYVLQIDGLNFTRGVVFEARL